MSARILAVAASVGAPVQDLEKITRPIQGWYITNTHGAYGGASIDEAEPLLRLEKDKLAQGKHPMGLAGSRLSRGVSRGIVNAVIVADPHKMLGQPIGAIADYIAVLALTQAFSVEHCGTLPSIMDMMLPSCRENEKVTSVTAGDLAFLRALYKADLEAVLPLERSSMDDSMMRQFQHR